MIWAIPAVVQYSRVITQNLKIIPREARRAEGPPSVARFINLSCGDRARIA